VQFKYLIATVAMLAFLAASWALERTLPGTAPAPETHASDLNDMSDGRYFDHLPKNFLMPTDEVGKLILREYGSLYVAREGVVPPRTTVFQNEEEVDKFQSSVSIAPGLLAGTRLELQKAAMTALMEAVAEAREQGLNIGPRGTDSARRRYQQTVDLWASRVIPGMKHWVAAGKVTQKEANRVLALSAFEQVPEILALEKKGIYFAKTLDKSIIYSVAPPGTSQHLSMLALDVAEFDNPAIRKIMEDNFWYQTVTSDLPHFTFLGAKEEDLPKLGLKGVQNSGRTFWIPDINEKDLP